jgi:predicted metal-binding membrane protein
MAALPSDAAAHCSACAESVAALLAPGELARAALAWVVMLIAMMLPLMTTAVRHVRDRSFPRRRVRALALFLGAYGLVWILGGALLIPTALLLRASSDDAGVALLLAALVVVAWQVSPWKQVCLNRLHAHPALPAFGAAADRGVLAFGVEHGAWCFGSCWGLMLLPMLVPGAHFAAMLLASLWVWGEHLSRPAPPRWSLRVPVAAARIIVAQARLRAAAPPTFSAPSRL